MVVSGRRPVGVWPGRSPSAMALLLSYEAGWALGGTGCAIHPGTFCLLPFHDGQRGMHGMAVGIAACLSKHICTACGTANETCI